MGIKIKHVLEYLLVRVIVALLESLPYRVALFIGWLIAGFLHYVLRFRVSDARCRIREVFGDQYTEAQVRRIAWISWRNFVWCVVELTRLSSIGENWVKRHVVESERTMNALREHCATGKGAVLACPHMGSWELAGVVVQLSGIPIFFITGKQKNPLVDRYLNRLRGKTGIATVQRGSAMLKGVIKRLRAGGMLGFLPDVRMATEGVSVEFLGKKANVVGGMGLFARQADVPIFPGIVTRIGWSRHKMELGNPIWPDKNCDKRQDWQRMTQEAFNSVEQAIRRCPEQWFWFNKRWILDPL